MDWGKGILLSIIAFVAVIMTMVVISVRMEGIELVTENYYEAEIKYQDRIDETNSALDLNRQVIAYSAASKVLTLDLPSGSTGTLQLFRPSDSRLDREIILNVTEPGITSLPLHELKSGYWRIKLSWKEGSEKYYEEKKISI